MYMYMYIHVQYYIHIYCNSTSVIYYAEFCIVSTCTRYDMHVPT